MVSRKILVSAIQFLGESEGNFGKKDNINDIVTQIWMSVNDTIIKKNFWPLIFSNTPIHLSYPGVEIAAGQWTWPAKFYHLSFQNSLLL